GPRGGRGRRQGTPGRPPGAAGPRPRVNATVVNDRDVATARRGWTAQAAKGAQARAQAEARTKERTLAIERPAREADAQDPAAQEHQGREPFVVRDRQNGNNGQKGS